MMVNAEMQKRLGKDRMEASTEEFRGVLDNLEDLLQTLARRVRKAKGDYDKNDPEGSYALADWRRERSAASAGGEEEITLLSMQ